MGDMPAFLKEIRRGRPVPDSLVEEMCKRYEHVGGSPLLRHTEAQAEALAEATGLEARVAMRLWSPRVEDVTGDWGPNERVIVVPMAPYSVEVYEGAARAALGKRDDAPSVTCVSAWGTREKLISAYVTEIEKLLGVAQTQNVRVFLTAHSLPVAVIRAGDRYESLFREAADLVAARVNADVRICFQSQGATGAEWLGPDLSSAMVEAHKDGVEEVIVSPIGFFAEHIETLYDLDVELKQQCDALGLQLHRVPAIGTHPGLISSLAEAVEDAK